MKNNKKKEREYKRYLEEIIFPKEEIKKEDIIQFLQEAQFGPYGIEYRYEKLIEKYPQNSLLNEIERVTKIANCEASIIYYEFEKKMQKDKNNIYTKEYGMKFEITKERTERYKEEKKFLKFARQKCDYDMVEQFAILEEIFHERYTREEWCKDVEILDDESECL